MMVKKCTVQPNIYCQNFVLYINILYTKLYHKSVKMRKEGKNWAEEKNNLFWIYMNYKYRFENETISSY